MPEGTAVQNVGHELTLKKLAQLRFRKGLEMPAEFKAARKGLTARLRELLHGLIAREGRWVVDRCTVKTGHCLLHEAACEGHQDTVIMLLDEFGADVHTRTLMGLDTPLHLAAAQGHRRVCFYMMVRFGADPNLINRYKQTPLHYAEELTTIKTLIKYGAKVTMPDLWGLTPVECAMQRGDADDTIDYLNEVLEAQERVLFKMDVEERQKAQHELDMLRDQALAAQHKTAQDKALHNATRDYFLWRKYTLPPEKQSEEEEEHDVEGEFIPGGKQRHTPNRLGPNSDELRHGEVYLNPDYDSEQQGGGLLEMDSGGDGGGGGGGALVHAATNGEDGGASL